VRWLRHSGGLGVDIFTHVVIGALMLAAIRAVSEICDVLFESLEDRYR